VIYQAASKVRNAIVKRRDREAGRHTMNQANPKAFLEALAPGTRQLVLALRDVVRRTVPQAEESVVWGSLSYHRPEVGGRVKGAVCQIVVKAGRVRLDFVHGIRLADPSGLLQGKRVSKRFVPVKTLADAERPEFVALIREAAALDPAEWVYPQSGRVSRSRPLR
jgi:hypothetical protein